MLDSEVDSSNMSDITKHRIFLMAIKKQIEFHLHCPPKVILSTDSQSYFETANDDAKDKFEVPDEEAKPMLMTMRMVAMIVGTEAAAASTQL